MITETDIYHVARELVGTPYLHKGRKKDLGIDCIGVPIWVGQRLNLGIEDFYAYSKNPDGTMEQRISKVFEDVVLQPGALLVFKIGSVAQHCGIVSRYMNGLGLIHAWDIARKVVEHRLTHEWYDRIVGCYGLPKVFYK